MLPPTESVKIEPVRQEKAVESWLQSVVAVKDAVVSLYRGEEVDFCGIVRNAIRQIRETFNPLSDNLEGILWDLEGRIDRLATSPGNFLDGANEVFNELSRIVQIIESGGAQDLNKNDTIILIPEKKPIQKTKNDSTPVLRSFEDHTWPQTEDLSHQLDDLKKASQTLSNGEKQAVSAFCNHVEIFVQHVRDALHPENGSGLDGSLKYLLSLSRGLSTSSAKDKNKKAKTIGEVLDAIGLHIEGENSLENRPSLLERTQHSEPLNQSESKNVQVQDVLNEMRTIHENVARGHKTSFTMEQDRQKLIALCSQLTVGATSHLSRTIQKQTLSHLKSFSSYVKNGGQMGDGIYMKKWKDLEQDLSMLSKTGD